MKVSMIFLYDCRALDKKTIGNCDGCPMSSDHSKIECVASQAAARFLDDLLTYAEARAKSAGRDLLQNPEVASIMKLARENMS